MIRKLLSDIKNIFHLFIVHFLRWIGHLTPDIIYLKALPNRLLKPLHNILGIRVGVFRVLGFQMRLDPNECVDGNLYFSPHLYDRKEIKLLQSKMPFDGLLVDIGGNIGFWSLHFAYNFPHSRILVIEANPITFSILSENISINAFKNIEPLQVGVSDIAGSLSLWCNNNGNRGADSFLESSKTSNRFFSVNVRPLLDILLDANISSIDILKIDIEGFESRVLSKFLADAPIELWPRFICAEVIHDANLSLELTKNGYQIILKTSENCVFELLAR